MQCEPVNRVKIESFQLHSIRCRKYFLHTLSCFSVQDLDVIFSTPMESYIRRPASGCRRCSKAFWYTYPGRRVALCSPFHALVVMRHFLM
ncbi:hypothetical protein E2C01_091581 [Portunus trituberculatus]|uniref:Uncharacterized protein n=1 Tax=Portunus trituberculatus TaxID=210409 RepID=A0A5B7JTA1_PORTR|nr:hypothetical protein [Portunus trituberculatus]